jgi:uncharacterized surface protein with fasciclin (FAS1) repeats
MRKTNIYLKLLLVFVVTSCVDPFINQTYIEKTDEDTDLSNASYLKKNEATYSMFIDLLKYADLYNALNDANTTSTVFAPNNEAMTKFLAWKGVSTVRELDKDYAKAVAQVHIFPSNIAESSFIAYVEAGTIPIKNIFGTYLSTSYGFLNEDIDDVDKDTVQVQDAINMYLNNQAKVEVRAIKTANGEVYSMGGVVHPLTETIPEILKQKNEYGIFLEALKKTGYNDSLTIYADTILNSDGSSSINTSEFTCFAVPDKVYEASSITNVNDLITFLGAGTDFLNDSNALKQYVAYHILDKKYSTSQIFSFQEANQVVLLDTKLSSQVLAVQNKNGLNKINEVVSITRNGIKARNGLIHKVDNIMMIYEPAPVTVRWDFCNSADIKSFVNAYGASHNYGEMFTSALVGSDRQVDLSFDYREGNYGTINSFTYVANTAKSPTSSFRKVGFLKCLWTSTTQKTVNKYGAYMDNLLILNLGYAGWVQLKSPTIVKGKYKVILYYASTPALKTFYSGGSLTKFNLGDYQKSLYLWKGLPDKFVLEAVRNYPSNNGTGLASDVLWDQVEFTKSEGHSFKATMMDINAKTNSLYRQMWDYIEFIPITE